MSSFGMKLIFAEREVGILVSIQSAIDFVLVIQVMLSLDPEVLSHFLSCLSDFSISPSGKPPSEPGSSLRNLAETSCWKCLPPQILPFIVRPVFLYQQPEQRFFHLHQLPRFIKLRNFPITYSKHHCTIHNGRYSVSHGDNSTFLKFSP